MMLDYQRLSAGTIIDQRYRIKKLVKAGGMGAVYQAEDQLMDMKLCAVKEMLDSFTDPADRRAAIDRFLSEVQVLGSLSHSNIPHVRDHFLENNNFYFVMEYIDGIDLATMLSQQGNPGLEEYKVIEWAIQVCEALEYLHSLKPPIAHRDIKSSNLILRHSDGRILLIDFGIARVTNPSEGFWIGSAGYAPPEQQAGKPEPRSDLYALGATIHELVTGRKPESFNFPALKELGVDSPKLDELLKRALEWDPGRRISSATEMKESFRRFSDIK
ncbi:MAG: serine/threonine protein kinase [Firmicutes bacterium]|nr:serine/threonine protein kinase [Bacillota bacterium]